MIHKAIDAVFARTEMAKGESDFSYFFSLLLAGEAIVKTMVLGLVAAINDDSDNNRYRLEYQLVRADGLGDWSKVFEDALSGPAAQFLSTFAYEVQGELTRQAKNGDWQYDATEKMHRAAIELGLEPEDVPPKTDIKRWIRIFAQLRNKTRAHGATSNQAASQAIPLLLESLTLVWKNCRIFRLPWAYLHQNYSKKYRVSQVTDNCSEFDYLKRIQDDHFLDGLYIYYGNPRFIPLIQSDPELQDFFFANGNFGTKKYELLSYYSDSRRDGSSAAYQMPPGTLPPSETQGHGIIMPMGKCFSNAPEIPTDYVDRRKLEEELEKLLIDDKHPIVTLVGRGGIGKTSLALKTIKYLSNITRYECIIWLSARDVDLQLTGPKSVRPAILSQEDMGKIYASLVLSEERTREKGFSSRAYLESQLQHSEIGPTLFVFDNFETTHNPIEVFNWIDTYIRLPNKALITTRLREFKGDYPIEVEGMREEESRELITRTSAALDISEILTPAYIADIIRYSEGHPYVMKILLGEVTKANAQVNIPHLISNTQDILTALFERTYSALSPCAQRALLTLSAWNSPVPRIALEAVLYRSTEERSEVEKGVESLLNYSMAEILIGTQDKQEFIFLPLVAFVFGKKKLSISSAKDSIKSDVEILRMLGTTQKEDVHLGLAKRLETFLSNLSRRADIDADNSDYIDIIKAICRAYNPGWLLLARWHLEQETMEANALAVNELRYFLENEPNPEEAIIGWRMLGRACYLIGDLLEEIHALTELARYPDVSFNEVSQTASWINKYLHENGGAMSKSEKLNIAAPLLEILEARKAEANAIDFSRMAWLAINSGQDARAIEYVQEGMKVDPWNSYLINLSQRLGI